MCLGSAFKVYSIKIMSVAIKVTVSMHRRKTLRLSHSVVELALLKGSRLTGDGCGNSTLADHHGAPHLTLRRLR